MCAAPPIVGAWSMAVLLWQLFEYYIAQAGADLEVTCSVSVVDHLVSSPSVEWRGDNIDSRNVKVEMIDN